MALLKKLEDINKLIPKKEEWIKNKLNSYFKEDNDKSIYAFMLEQNTKKPVKILRVSFCVFKGVGMSYLIFLEHDKPTISSKSPSVGRDTKTILNATENEWGFKTDETGLYILTNSPMCKYMIYFGEHISDFKKIEKSNVLKLETIYV